MIRLRTKLWYMVAGAEIALSLLAAMANAPYLLLLTIPMSIVSWYVAEYLLEIDIVEYFIEMSKEKYWPKEKK